MSVEMLRIEVDSRRVTEALRSLRAAVADPSDALSDVAATLYERVSGRFETASDPEGRGWAAKKGGAPSRLYEYGDLLDSLGWRANSHEAVVGFGQPYAAYHEFGTKRMPRRGMLFADPESGTLSDDDEKAILDILEHYLLKAVK